jgi:two-component system response regulator
MSEYDNVDVLVVEDNKFDAEMIMRALAKANFVNPVHWVKDGVEALEFIRCEGEYRDRKPLVPLKLVLLDLKMPRLDGFDVLQELKSHESTRTIPIVTMTSSHREADVSDSYRLGANGYVTKPVQFSEFISVVAKIGMFWLLVNKVD